jgi:hypothetical protein
MAIYSVYVINKAGSLIYYQAFGNGPKLATNETIFLASMFHGYVIRLMQSLHVVEVA